MLATPFLLSRQFVALASTIQAGSEANLQSITKLNLYNNHIKLVKNFSVFLQLTNAVLFFILLLNIRLSIADQASSLSRVAEGQALRSHSNRSAAAKAKADGRC
jgi:hypothetical protein